MNPSVFGLCCVFVSVFCSGSLAGAFAADTNSPPRLTVELRDGSRVVGTCVEKFFKFHSALLGELKLEVQNIRSVECVSTNSAKLSTANGDSLTVSFAEPEFAVKTSFGTVELAVDSVHSLTVTAGGNPGSHPPGLVALWSGEDNGRDSVGGNDVKLMDMDFADGKVGRAFSLNGFSSCMKVADNPGLNVGGGEGLTITAWIKPSNVSGFHPIMEWNPGEKIPGTIGVQLWIGHLPGSQGVLQANVVSTDGRHHVLTSSPGMLAPGSFQHVALTYDKAGGMGILYLNGTVVARSRWASFVPLTTGDFWISRRPTDHPGDWTYNAFFAGLLDEIAIYNRALSISEIEAVCKDDNNGELPPAPMPGSTTPFNGIYRDGSGE